MLASSPFGASESVYIDQELYSQRQSAFLHLLQRSARDTSCINWYAYHLTNRVFSSPEKSIQKAPTMVVELECCAPGGYVPHRIQLADVLGVVRQDELVPARMPKQHGDKRAGGRLHTGHPTGSASKNQDLSLLTPERIGVVPPECCY